MFVYYLSFTFAVISCMYEVSDSIKIPKAGKQVGSRSRSKTEICWTLDSSLFFKTCQCGFGSNLQISIKLS